MAKQTKQQQKEDSRAEHPAGRDVVSPTRANVWTRRWTALRDHYGFSLYQAQAVCDLLNDLRAFGSSQLAKSAQQQLDKVYEGEATDE